jgi:hypothetical protein
VLNKGKKMLENAKKEVLKETELYLEKLINGPFVDMAVEDLKVELKALIKGPIDDAVIDLVVPALLPLLKKFLADQAEKISEEV